MDWQTVLVATLSSGVVGVFIGYLLNRRLELAKAHLQEELRRRGTLYDQQVQALFQVSEMGYRLRNAMRDLALPLPEVDRLALGRVEKAHDALAETLYRSRGILPEVVFSVAHDLKGPVNRIMTLLARDRSYKKYGKQLSKRELEAFSEGIKSVEQQFQALVDLVQTHAGLNDTAPNTRLHRTAGFAIRR